MSGENEYPTATQSRLDGHETPNNAFCDAPATFGVASIVHGLVDDCGVALATPECATPSPSIVAMNTTTRKRTDRMRSPHASIPPPYA
jgi:hypothetical protein